MKAYRAKNRSILRLSGPENKQFLNKLVTQDINLLADTKSLYSLLLSAQGRYLHDFFVIPDGSDILIDVKKTKAADLLKRLNMYKMRSEVAIEEDLNLEVILALHADATEDLNPGQTSRDDNQNIICVDPRYCGLGVRIYGAAAPNIQELSDEDYDEHRLRLGIPETDKDLIFDKTIPLEAGLDDLNAICFTKGCYLGQELTTRTKHQGLVRKRLLPVTIEGITPSYEDDIFFEDKKVGSMRSSSKSRGIALIRLEVFATKEKNLELTSNSAKVIPHILSWHQI